MRQRIFRTSRQLVWRRRDLRDRDGSLALAVACGFMVVIKVVVDVVPTLLAVIAIGIIRVMGRLW